MENLAPPLDFLYFLLIGIKSGDSIPNRVRSYCIQSNNNFVPVLSEWLIAIEGGKKPVKAFGMSENHYRRMVLEVLDYGTQGGEVLKRIRALIGEMNLACDQEIKLFIGQLPFRLMIPLIFFYFPSLIMVMVLPLLLDLMEKLNQ